MTIPDTRAPWRRSIVRLRAASAGPGFSMISAPFRHASAAAARVGADRKPTPTRYRSRCEVNFRNALLLDGDPHRRPQTAHRAVAKRNIAAMRARDIAGDGEAKTGAALVLVARIVEPQERLEHFFTHVRRNASAVIIHRQSQPAVIAVAGNRDRWRMARRV